jgi:hypothetical protein
VVDSAGLRATAEQPHQHPGLLQRGEEPCLVTGLLRYLSDGVPAAHVRWFSFGGPDALDNGLALCVLHHKLFDLGVLGLDATMRVQVSAVFTARTTAGRAVYDLHGHELQPRPGTTLPATRHVSWHTREVFKGPTPGGLADQRATGRQRPSSRTSHFDKASTGLSQAAYRCRRWPWPLTACGLTRQATGS